MSPRSHARNFLTVTELPGAGATPEQLSMLYTRYHLAGNYAAGRDVLEVGCGAGIGLGYIASRAQMVVGGDCDEALVSRAAAARVHGARIVRLDANALPFRDGTFDVVVLFEALYYLEVPEQFVGETRRVLRPGGTLLICTANREYPGFTPSLYAVRYFSAEELHGLLGEAGFAVEVFGAHPGAATTGRGRVILAARRVASTLRLIPSTLGGRAILKRIVYGKLRPIPAEVREGMAALSSLAPVSDGNGANYYRVLFAVGRVP